MIDRTAVVLWSGGADSTLLLWALLTAGQPVRTLTILHHQVGAHHQQAVARLAATMRLRDAGHTWRHCEVVVEGDASITPGGLPQPALWLTLGAAYVREREDLVVGWHRGDNAIQQRRGSRTCYDAFEVVADMIHLGDPAGTRPRLAVPLQNLNKAQIVAALDDADLGDVVWTCEAPPTVDSMDPCGRCVPCMTLTTARLQRASLPEWGWLAADEARECIMNQLRLDREE